MRQEIVPYEKKISLCVGFLGGPQGHSFYNVWKDVSDLEVTARQNP